MVAAGLGRVAGVDIGGGVERAGEDTADEGASSGEFSPETSKANCCAADSRRPPRRTGRRTWWIDDQGQQKW